MNALWRDAFVGKREKIIPSVFFIEPPLTK